MKLTYLALSGALLCGPALAEKLVTGSNMTYLAPDVMAHDMQVVIIRDMPKVSPEEFPKLADAMAEGIRKALTASVGATSDPCDKPPTGQTFSSCIVAIGENALYNATTMYGTIAIGRYSGYSLTTESMDILIGDYTSAPHGMNGFVNLANTLCFWRDTGVVETCPPPESEVKP